MLFTDTQRRRRMLAGAKKKAFVPTSIANMALWLDASDLSTITQVAGSVSQWNDKSGNINNATQATSTLQPLTGVDTINSKNVLKFDTVLHQGFNLASAISRVNGYTFFGVVLPSAIGNGTRELTSSRTATGSTAWGVLNSNAQTILEVGGSGYGTGTNILSSVNASIIAAKTSAAGQAGYFNGSADFANATVPTYTTDINCVSSPNNSFAGHSWSGDLAEIMIYTRILTSSEMNLIGNYLAAKWGIAWTTIP